MRPMQQAPMAPTHQPLHPHAPHPHRTHQQFLSMAPHQQQIHHMQHPMTNPRMLMGIHNTSNPNKYRRAIFTLVIVICALLLSDADAKIHRSSLLDSVNIRDHLHLIFGPNGCITGNLVGVKEQVIPLTLHNHPSLQHHQQPQIQHQPIHQQIQQNIEQKANDDTGELNNGELNNKQQQGQGNSTNSNLANTREKTPMCLVNELARFNKIQHQYRLTNEQGPSHKKRFTVTLMLGEEEYVAEGPSIKKAQHSAASEALEKTWYRQPPPKPTRTMKIYGKNPNGSGGHLPPTVELNALAMKRGEATIYTFRHAPPAMSTPPHHQFMPHGYGNFNHLRLFNPRYPGFNRNFHPEPQGMYLVSLKVGEREFIGRGMTGQAARHDAASRALEQLRQLPMPEEVSNVNNTVQGEDSVNRNSIIDDPNAELKSPVSLVHETALKRGLSVCFDVMSETGKPHIRTFMTRCTVGEKVTVGEGSSKKVSKKRSAELMLDELKRMPPIPAPVQNRSMRVKRKPPATKKKSRNLIKVYQEPRSESDSSEDVNPISRLVQIQQAKREREPVYNLIEEIGPPRRREFIMEVSVGQHSAQGTGPNKKLAKRAAADALLNILGYSKPQPQPVKPSIKTSSLSGNNCAENKEKDQSEHKRKVTFVEVDNSNETTHSYPPGGTIGRQLVPGLLFVDSGSDSKVISGPSVQVVAEELRGQQQPQPSGVSPKDQLKYLAQLLNFEVQFSDFPKGTYKEYLSLVSLSTDPPQVCHGHGPTKNASRDQAARTALRTLSKMGLDSVTNSGAKKDNKGNNSASGAGANDPPGMHNVFKSNNVINGGLEK